MSLKNLQNKFMLLIIVIMSSFCNCVGSERMITIRPIKIKILDSESNLPIENVKVYYQVKSYVYHDTILFIIPRPEKRVVEKTEVIKQFRTNHTGELLINNVEVILKEKEKIYSEEIAINLDVDLTKIKVDMEDTANDIERVKKPEIFFKYLNITDSLNISYFFNPIKQYKGYYIYSTYWPIDPNDFGGTSRKKYEILWNGMSLKKEHEKIIVKLKRY